jgi:hypothetical protein
MSSTREIDIVALGPTNEVLVATCKWGDVSDSDLAALRAATPSLHAELLRAYREGPIFHACFSGRGAWGPGVARAVSEGVVLGFTGASMISS